MKKLLFVAVAFAGLALVSCNKDQAAVKKLDGAWNVTSLKQTQSGVTYDPIATGDISSMTITFTECKLKTDEWCPMTTTTTPNGFPAITESGVYRVTGDGTTLEQKEHADSTEVITATIDELTKETFKGTQVEGDITTVIEASK